MRNSMTLVVLFKDGNRVSVELKYEPQRRGHFQRVLSEYGFHMWEGRAAEIADAVVVADGVYHYVGDEAAEVLGLEG